jgi:hypothetical protein
MYTVNAKYVLIEGEIKSKTQRELPLKEEGQKRSVRMKIEKRPFVFISSRVSFIHSTWVQKGRVQVFAFWNICTDFSS